MNWNKYKLSESIKISDKVRKSKKNNPKDFKT